MMVSAKRHVLDALILNAIQEYGGTVPTESRLNKIIYLADWLHALRTGKSMTGLEWMKQSDYVPFLKEVNAAAGELPQIKRDSREQSGQIRTSYVLQNGCGVPALEPSHRDAIKAACEALAGQPPAHVVHATPPMADARTGQVLDLEGKAREIRLQKARDFAQNELPKYSRLMDKLAE